MAAEVKLEPHQLSVVVFLASVRPNRMAERVKKFLSVAISAKAMSPIFFDPLEMDFKIVKVPIHFMPKPKDVPDWLKEANEKIKTADAFIIASAEYNSYLPPALTNMIDHFPKASFRNRPVGLLTYSTGSFGGFRASTFLSAFVAEFGMLPVPSSVVIPDIGKTMREDGIVTEDTVLTQIGKLLEDLWWFALAIKKHGAVKPPPEP